MVLTIDIQRVKMLSGLHYFMISTYDAMHYFQRYTDFNLTTADRDYYHYYDSFSFLLLLSEIMKQTAYK